MRIVLDTNILIGALITKGTPPDSLYQAWLKGEIELVTSTAQLAEVAAVLARPACEGISTPTRRRRSSRTSTRAPLSSTRRRT